MKSRKTAPILCQCQTCISQTYDDPSGNAHRGKLWPQRAYQDHVRDLNTTARTKLFASHLSSSTGSDDPSPSTDSEARVVKHHREKAGSSADPHNNLSDDLVAVQLKSDGDRLQCSGDVLAGFEMAEIRFLAPPELGSTPLDPSVPPTDPRLQLDASHHDSQMIQDFEVWLLAVDSRVTDGLKSVHAGRRVVAERNRRILETLFPKLAELKQRAYNRQLEMNPVYTGDALPFSSIT